MAVAPEQASEPREAALALQSLSGHCAGAAGATAADAAAFTQAWSLLYAAVHVLDRIEDEDVVDAPWAQTGD